ncbi:MAG: ester cyclase [Polyangiaceae bacterium]
MRKGFGRLGALMAIGVLAAACGGGDEAAKQVQQPPPPPVAADTTPAPTTTVATPAPAKPTLAELQATALKTIADAMNAHDAAKFVSAYTDDVSSNQFGMPPVASKADLQKNIQMYFDTYKDMKFWVTRTWTKNDVVATEWGWSGTDTGGFMGAKPTEKPAGSMGMTVAWFTPDGLIKKEDRYVDLPTSMTQLGLAKGKAKPVPTMATSVEAHVAKGTADEDKQVDWAKAIYTSMDTHKSADFLGALDDNSDFMDASAATPAPMKGKAEAKKFFDMWTKAFPDSKTTLNNVMSVENFVIVESEMTATQKGPIGPIAATKKPVDIHSVDVYQVANGKMIHGWSYSNSGELMMQIGVMKAPPAAGAAADAKANPDKGGKGAKGSTPTPPKK